MKIYYFFILTFFVSCKNESGKLTGELHNQKEAFLNTKRQDLKPEVHNDSMIVSDNRIIILEYFSKSEFEKLEKITFLDSTILIKKTQEGELVLPVKNGKKIILRDTLQNTDSGEQVFYEYLGFYEKIACYLVRERFYESGGYLLINKENGSINKLWSPPQFSEDNKKFVTYSGYLAYDIMPTGIQMWEVKAKGKFSLLWEFETKAWEPAKLVWIDDSNLAMKRVVPDFISKSSKEETNYVKFSYK